MKIQVNEQTKKLQILKNKLLIQVYQSTIKKETITRIHKELLNISKVFGWGGLIVPATKLAKKIQNMDAEESLRLIFLAFTNFNKPIYKEVAMNREDAIKEATRIAHESGRVFYLCSWHGDSATDHAPYQGKMYYDSNAILTKEERKYVLEHNLKSVQWVMDRPVYLLTRPHCRHWFLVLETKEVLENSVRKLLEKHHMITEKGHKKPKNIIYAEKYEERLKFHKELQKINDNPTIQAKISKDKALINKWKLR